MGLGPFLSALGLSPTGPGDVPLPWSGAALALETAIAFEPRPSGWK
jgi:hypothetical protein